MKAKLTVRFTSEGAARGELAHQVRNFAEDLHRALLVASIGTVKNMDAAVNTVLIEVQSTRMVGEAMTIAKAELKRHKLVTSAVFER